MVTLYFCSLHVRLLRALIMINQSINQSVNQFEISMAYNVWGVWVGLLWENRTICSMNHMQGMGLLSVFGWPCGETRLFGRRQIVPGNRYILYRVSRRGSWRNEEHGRGRWWGR